MDSANNSPSDTTPIVPGQFSRAAAGFHDPQLESSIDLLNDLIQGYASCGIFLIKGAMPKKSYRDETGS